jgi:hypothetical protein
MYFESSIFNQENSGAPSIRFITVTALARLEQKLFIQHMHQCGTHNRKENSCKIYFSRLYFVLEKLSNLKEDNFENNIFIIIIICIIIIIN